MSQTFEVFTVKSRVFKLLDRLEQRDKKERVLDLSSEERVKNIHPDSARLLNLLARISKSEHILEIGSRNGYSTIWLGLAARENQGSVTTIEKDEIRVKEAMENFKESGLEDIITLYHGNALDILPTLQEKWDFIFIDAEKSEHTNYFELILEKLLPGGVIITDNIVSHEDELKEYLETIRSHPKLESQLIPIGRGLELSYKQHF